jgi:hypothetical protein
VSGIPIDGTGASIAVVGLAQFSQKDLDAFRSLFGLPPSAVTVTVVPDTGAPAAGTGGTGTEAVLDLEWAGGIARGAALQYVLTGAGDGNVDDATLYAIEQNLAPIISESYGGCERGVPASDADVLQVFGAAANLMGITHLASSGDSGAAGCAAQGSPGLYVQLPSTLPGVTAVGGTEFPSGSLTYNDAGYATGYGAQESAWNDGNDPSAALAAGGGGISALFGRPSYQAGLSTCSILGSLPESVDPSAMRLVPDLAAGASAASNPYFAVCTISSTTHECGATGGAPQVIQVGGTSVSTPAIAGVVALLNQALGERLGNINPLLYQLRASAPSAFHDITQGDNEILCAAGSDPGCPDGGKYGFAATTGYDCATGLGSIDAQRLVGAWAALAPTTTQLTLSPQQTSEGADVTLTALVQAPTPNANALSGVVTFVFESYSPTGAVDLSWPLGAGQISGGSTTFGSAVFHGTVPPGLVTPGTGRVDVAALYGGDGHHLASSSSKVPLTFTPVSFCVSPGAAALSFDAGVRYATGAGVAPFSWVLKWDTTCDANGNCSLIDADSGSFVSGPKDGYVVVAAIDRFGAEALSEVTVGAPTLAPPWGDAGLMAGVCDAGTVDAGPPPDAGPGPTVQGAGCGCGVDPWTGGGLLAALAAAILRRRRTS